MARVLGAWALHAQPASSSPPIARRDRRDAPVGPIRACSEREDAPGDGSRAARPRSTALRQADVSSMCSQRPCSGHESGQGPARLGRARLGPRWGGAGPRGASVSRARLWADAPAAGAGRPDRLGAGDSVLPAGIIFLVMTSTDLQALIADTEATILSLIDEHEDDATRPLYEQMRYHLGLDGGNGTSGKRMRPLLGLLAYQSLTGSHERALPGAAAVELGHNFSLVHDDIEDGDHERRHRAALWTIWGVAQGINTGDAMFALSRLALHRLTDLGFSDARVLALMRLYDETCLTLCEGQFLDLWTSEEDGRQSVQLYFDMIGRKTAALIAGSIQAGAMLATDDRRHDRRLPRLRLGPGPRLPAQRRPAGHLGRGAGDGQAADRPGQAQAHPAGPLRPRARGPGRPAPPEGPPRRGVADRGHDPGDPGAPGAERRAGLHARAGAPPPRRGRSCSSSAPGPRTPRLASGWPRSSPPVIEA